MDKYFVSFIWKDAFKLDTDESIIINLSISNNTTLKDISDKIKETDKKFDKLSTILIKNISKL